MVKISNLPDHEGAPAADDLVALIDVSDPTEAASGTSKKLTVEEMMAAGVTLTDGAGVHGSLPLSRVAFPVVATFQMTGPVSTGVGDGIWVCEYPQARILAVRASVGRLSAPSLTPVIVDVHAGPPFTSILPAVKPSVPVGAVIGERLVLEDDVTISRGDALSAVVDQTDEDAKNLLITVYMMAIGFPETSFVPGAPAEEF